MPNRLIKDTPANEAMLSVDAAIAAIEAEACADTVQVDLGNGLIAKADGRLGLGGLLQRLRSHKVLTAFAQMPVGQSATPMRPFTPDMHPDVAIILDALRNAN